MSTTNFSSRWICVLGVAFVVVAIGGGCAPRHDAPSASTRQPDPPANNQREDSITSPPERNAGTEEPWVAKTDQQWRALLTPLQYEVTRQKGTERPFANQYWDSKTKGVYHCVGCKLPLFHSDQKYKSGTGWPSFWAPLHKTSVREEVDDTLFARRTEVLCSRCGAHLGHVFDDGPQPTGQRYCMNSAAMQLQPDADTEASDAQPNGAANGASNGAPADVPQR